MAHCASREVPRAVTLAPMREVVLTVRPDDLEEVLDRLLPLLPQGVHETPGPDGALALTAFGDGPPLAELEAAAGGALLGAAEGEAPDDPGERRLRMIADRPAIAGVSVRPSAGAAPETGVLDVVIDSPDGAFGAGTHPTTAMCLELLMGLEPGGPFADLGCGTGVLAITAALRGWRPVLAVDHEALGVQATEANALRNRVELGFVHADLLEVDPPPVGTIAANVPPAVHAHIAATLPGEVRTLILSGVAEEALDEVAGAYRGLRVVNALAGRGWAAALLVRDA
jgi:ribosomal protein L11 methyltransferase